MTQDLNAEPLTLSRLKRLKKKCLLFQFYCLARQVGTQGPSLGHSGTKPWASTDQATGIRCPWGGHTVPKRWAIFGHFTPPEST